MNRSTKMLMVASSRNRNRNEDGEYRRDYGRSDYGDGGSMNYGPDSRFRDRRGREHYDNGRYAPMNDGDMWVDSRYRDDRHSYDSPESHYPMTTPYVPPVYERYDNERGGQRPMNKIGFSMEGEMGRAEEFEQGYRSDAGYQPMNEMQSRRSSRESGYAYGGSGPMTKEMACEWADGMKNEDGTRGPHWNIDQVKQVMGQHNINGNPWEVYAVLNSIYSDYCKVFRKYGVGDDINFYIDMTKAWMNDADSVKNKATAYFENVVKH